MFAIGIDMSKDSFHAAFDESTVRVFRNTDEGVSAFIDHIQTRYAPDDTTVGTEATGIYHLLLCERLRMAKWRVVVINPLITHRRLASRLRKVKTDRSDALIVRTARLREKDIRIPTRRMCRC